MNWKYIAVGVAVAAMLQLAYSLTTDMPTDCSPAIQAQEGCVADFLTGSLTCKYVTAESVIVKHGY